MIVSIPKPLREKLGDEGSESFIEMMNQLEENQTNAVLALSEQRFEKALTREFGDLKLESNATITDLRKEMHDEIRKLWEEIYKLREDMQKMRADIIKWMFIFLVGQTGVLAGLILVLLR
jgi:predicted  nucleic acid-binding Zn-ribbon protein